MYKSELTSPFVIAGALSSGGLPFTCFTPALNPIVTTFLDERIGGYHCWMLIWQVVS